MVSTKGYVFQSLLMFSLNTLFLISGFSMLYMYTDSSVGNDEIMYVVRLSLPFSVKITLSPHLSVSGVTVCSFSSFSVYDSS